MRETLGEGGGDPPRGPRPPGWWRDQLFRRRMVFITGRLDDALAAEAAAEIMSLDASGGDPIDIHADIPDGTLEAAFVLIDVLDLVNVTVRAHCYGRIGGPAIGVVAAADHRSAAPHASFRLVQPVAQFSGTPDQLAAQSRQYRDLLWRFQARLARATGRPAEEIADDMRRGRYFTAQEALEYGLIDVIRSAPERR